MKLIDLSPGFPWGKNEIAWNTTEDAWNISAGAFFNAGMRWDFPLETRASN